MSVRLKALLLATAALAGLGWSGAAQAECVTTTAPGGPTNLTCAEDTTTTFNTNTNQNNPATNAREQRFGNAIVGRVTAGTDITGFGLFVTATGTQSVTFENQGTIANSGSNPDPLFNLARARASAAEQRRGPHLHRQWQRLDHQRGGRPAPLHQGPGQHLRRAPPLRR